MSARTIRDLSVSKCYIAPSILAADFSRLGEQIREADNAGADFFHLDIMDGHFVPNLSLGPAVVESVRLLSTRLFDVHLMISRPRDFVKAFVTAGANHITIHVESDGDLAQSIHDIHERGCSAGMSLRPATPEDQLLPYLEYLDLILVMTVEPGFGGQRYIRQMVPKIQRIRDLITASGRPIHLQVDGGINPSTGLESCRAGANILVAGSSIFRAGAGIAAAVADFKRSMMP